MVLFSFSSEGMKQINQNSVNVPFTFIISDFTIKCLGYQADFISPKIAKMRKNDPLLNKYIIKLPFIINKKICDDITLLLNGNKVEINKENLDYLFAIFCDLENDEFTSFFVKEEEITLDNVFLLITDYFYKGKNIDSLISYAAKNFFRLSLPKDIQLEVLEEILTNKDFCTSSENDLFDYISSLLNNNFDYYSTLLRFIHTEALSEEKAIEFSNLVDKIEDHELIASLWPTLKRRFIYPLRNPFYNPRYPKQPSIYCGFKDDPFDGIFNYLTKEYNGNIKELGVIHLSCSSVFSDKKLLKSILEDEGDWGTLNKKKPQWIDISFKPGKVAITGYSIRSHGHETWSKSQLRSWVLLGTNDEINWDVIDEQKDVIEFKKQFLKTKTFQTKETIFYSTIRLQRTTETWGNNYYLAFNRLEFFGYLLDPRDYSEDNDNKETTETTSSF